MHFSKPKLIQKTWATTSEKVSMFQIGGVPSHGGTPSDHPHGISHEIHQPAIGGPP